MKDRLLSVDCWMKSGEYANIVTFNRANSERKRYARDVQFLRLINIVNQMGGKLVLKPLGWTFYTAPLDTNEDYLFLLEMGEK